jgi:hypothetical protein
MKVVRRPVYGSNSCQVSRAAKNALEKARNRSSDLNVIDLLDQAEAAVGPPECDAVRYKILFEKACEHIGVTSASGTAMLLDSGERSPESSGDLRTLISGATRSGTTSKGLKFHVYYAPDGEMFGRTTTKRNTESNDTGTWEINQDDKICQQWRKWRDRKRYCFTITPLGGNRYLADSTGTENSVSQGDTQGLDSRVTKSASTADPVPVESKPEVATEVASTSSNANNDATTTTVSTVSSAKAEIDYRSLSGTYRVEISGLEAKRWLNSSDRTLKLVQNGTSVTGKLGSNISIWGQVTGNWVKFEYINRGVVGEGEWLFDSRRSAASGTWKSGSTNARISNTPNVWNLIRTE